MSARCKPRQKKTAADREPHRDGSDRIVTVVCEHLQALEQALIEAGIEVTYRGQAWGNANEWVYFDCVLDLAECRTRFCLPDFVVDHVHRGTHDGTEQGVYCKESRDGIMGRHPDAFPSDIVFP